MRYRRAVHRFTKEAAASRVFSTIRGFTDISVRKQFPDFFDRHAAILRWNVRGFGYWIWKPFLIRKAIAASKADFVLYSDAGCTLNLRSPAQQRRLQDYCAWADAHGLLAFQVQFRERAFCKRDTAHRFGLTDAQLDSGQYMATVTLFKNTKNCEHFVGEWYDIMAEDNYRYCNDDLCKQSEDVSFVDHRHDQAVFSCLVKRAGLPGLPDETWFGPEWPDAARTSPIWAPRHYSCCPFQPGKPLSLLRRCELFADRLEGKALKYIRP